MPWTASADATPPGDAGGLHENVNAQVAHDQTTGTSPAEPFGAGDYLSDSAGRTGAAAAACDANSRHMRSSSEIARLLARNVCLFLTLPRSTDRLYASNAGSRGGCDKDNAGRDDGALGAAALGGARSRSPATHHRT